MVTRPRYHWITGRQGLRSALRTGVQATEISCAVVGSQNMIPGHSVHSLVSIVIELSPRCIPSVELSVFSLSYPLRCRCLHQTKTYNGPGVASYMSVCDPTLRGDFGKSHGFIQWRICFQCLMAVNFVCLSVCSRLLTVMKPPSAPPPSRKSSKPCSWPPEYCFYRQLSRAAFCHPCLGLSLKRKPGKLVFRATFDLGWLNEGWIIFPVLGACGLLSPSDTVLIHLSLTLRLLMSYIYIYIYIYIWSTYSWCF